MTEIQLYILVYLAVGLVIMIVNTKSSLQPETISLVVTWPFYVLAGIYLGIRRLIRRR